MSRKEREPRTLDEWLDKEEKRRLEVANEGSPGRQRRLLKAITSLWPELLAMSQPNIPRAIKKITKGKITDTAATVLWLSPVPRLELNISELQKDSVALFIEYRQASRWKHDERTEVVNYFTEIVDNKLLKDKPPRVPSEIKKITKDKITESALNAIWLIPSPWLWGMDERDYSLDVRRSPYGMWNKDKELVKDYIKALSNNLDPVMTS